MDAGPEVIAVMRELPVLGRLLNSFYNCEYNGFFKALVEITPDLTRDRCAFALCSAMSPPQGLCSCSDRACVHV
jgi:hypothetical protein